MQCVPVSGSTQKHFYIKKNTFYSDPRHYRNFPVPLVNENIFVGFDAKKQNKQAKNNVLSPTLFPSFYLCIVNVISEISGSPRGSHPEGREMRKNERPGVRFPA